MVTPLDEIIHTDDHPITDGGYRKTCADRLNEMGVLALGRFLKTEALAHLQQEAQHGRAQAYFCTQNHSVYLTPKDANFPDDHPQNRQVVSSKGCICDDEVTHGSVLRTVYDNTDFREFVIAVTGETSLHPYADPLSSINIHYAERGQELGWHFDNSEFAITLLIAKPSAGSHFEYLKDVRDADAGTKGYDTVEALLDEKIEPQTLPMEPGTLVLFRGRNSIHRVSPNESDETRMLAVLAYNSEPGISLSESARMTFYGRLN